MKIKYATLLLIFALSACQSQAQLNLPPVLSSGAGGNLTNEKIIKGLKEALTIGTRISAENASKMDGFYKNPLIKIPFPKEAEQMEKSLKSIGMSKEVDNFVKTLNRAAEDASKKAAPVFIDAITKMSITDGLRILKGGNTAATEFLKSGTTLKLKSEFMPIVKTSLQKVEITKHWKPLVKNYNKIPFVKKMNPDLNDYVTTKAIEGLFKLIAEQELKIRKDPQARITDLLKEVFGGK
ncbi:MAG: DUF4197 domain-containing protein [Bacteroidota bacterium]|nr:DUF4197 domain-containing protein [Bacteroidota bacterium]